MGRNKWKEMRRRWVIRLVPPLASLLIRLLSATLRYRIHVSEGTRKIIDSGGQIIFAFWHGRMLIMPPIYHKVCGTSGKDAWIMVSQHLDGELIARTVKPFRILSVRGSSTRRGRKALQELVERVLAGHTVGITPDGPSGPCYSVQPGVVRMAQRTGGPIVPLTWAARPRWVAPSWDRFQVPLPFARASVVFDEPLYVPPGEETADLEEDRVLLEERLRQATERMEAEVREASAVGYLSTLRGRVKKTVSRLATRIRSAFQNLWDPSSQKGAVSLTLSALLAPLSSLYALVLQVRRSLYRKGILPKKRIGPPVISVGGIRVGGSGKTPFAMWMARRLSDRGFRVVLLTRGYGRRKKQGTILLTRQGLGDRDPLDCGDEPYLLAQSLPNVPVVVNGDRIRGARFAEKRFSPDLFLMDDGFQHLRLARGFDIVVVPADEDLSSMACLPRGPLREPISALRDADVVVCLCSDKRAEGNQRALDQPGWRGLEGDFLVHEARLVPASLHRLEDESEVNTREVAEREIAAFCGIARPGAFWNTLEGMGLKISCKRVFPDHHPYSEQDHEELLHLLSASDLAVTTEKDAVKIRRYRWPASKILFVRLELVLEDERAFWERLEAVWTVAKRGGVP
jgi:tetraacyldisaccharide 4'-kinase